MGTGADASSSDHLKMIGAVYSAFPSKISAEGIAASLLKSIGSSMENHSLEQSSRMEREQQVKKLKHIIRLVAQQLGPAFDGCSLLEALLSHDIQDESWTVRHEEDRARLMYQCALLLVPSPPKDAIRHPQKVARKGPEMSEADAKSLRTKLEKARKLFITWFCSDYGPHFSGMSKSTGGRDDPGAGFPNYQSALRGLEGSMKHSKWLSLARCLLFMENADSPQMLRFMGWDGPDGNNDSLSTDERYRIERCCEFGCDFDDEMMWIILKSASLEEGGIETNVALQLLEHLFESCSKHRQGSLKISDMMLVWELYTLVLYEPPEELVHKTEQILRLQNADNNNEQMNGMSAEAEEDPELPQ